MGGTRRVDDVVAPCYACTGILTQIYRFIKRQSAGIKFNLERKELISTGGRKKRGRKKGTKRPSSKMLPSPSNLHMYFWFQDVASSVKFTDFSRNTLQSPCRYVQCADDNFNILQISFRLQLRASRNKQMSISK